MAPIRVLLVDDSRIVQRMLSHTLRADPAIGQIFTVSSGEEALSQIARARPDAVVLDVQMPGMSGLEVLREIRRTDKKLPIIMFSCETGLMTKVTIEALMLGASDYVAKPDTRTVDVMREQLLPKIKMLAQPAPAKAAPPAPRPAMRPAARLAQSTSSAVARVQHLLKGGREARPQRPAPVRLVAIGSSTGGPQALETVLGALPGDFPVPVVVVQHMPPTYTAHLAQQLNQRCALRVREATSGATLAAGDVWIAKGGRHMTVRVDHGRARILLTDSAPENSCRPAVDVLFRSAAKAYGGGVLAAVLTGMGSDGARGAAAIVGAGGRVLAQDKDSSVVWGMPRAVIEAGVASRVLPLARIAPTLRAQVAGDRAVA